VILALAFSVTGFHAAEQDHKKGKK
jgi:hypothetical protein